MNAERAVETQHPHFVYAPDPSKVEGIRAYREPEVPHPLQLTFLEEAGELAWIAQTQALLTAGQSAEAHSRLASELAGFDGKLAQLCNGIDPAEVAIEGWDDLLPILAEWEGPPVTAITIGITNPPDLVFEAGVEHRPDLLINLYSDEAFEFTRRTKAELLAECESDMPPWIGGEEDVEFYCTISGLDALNTALIQCKHRHFLRDGRDGVAGRAPGGYVEYQLASWFMATLFREAVERAITDHGLPQGCRPIAGSVDMNADFACVLGSDQAFAPKRESTARTGEAAYASLTLKPWVPRDDPEAQPAATTLRQRIQSVEPEPEPQPEAESAPRPGLFARLFGGFRRG
jgi:hypothetical protein